MESNTPARKNKTYMSGQNNQMYTGLVLLLVGFFFLMRKLDIEIFPHWLFSWEVICIVVGVVIGVRTRFRGFFWMVPLVIGSVSLFDEIVPGLNIRRYAWPLIFIILGLIMVFRPKFMFFGKPATETDYGYEIPAEENIHMGASEKIDAVAIFGSVKKTIVSKNFAGGEIVSIMGGSEINLSKADIHGRVSLEVVSIMGGTKLIIPPTWDLHSEMAAVFGGVEDKRPVHQLQIDPKKVLVLEGTCIFGGLEIHSY